VLRFVDWLADAQPPVPVITVINKVPGMRFSSSEVADQVRSLCGEHVDVVTSAPYDKRVVAAEWDATLPASGPFTRALPSVVAAITATASADAARVPS
jgi:hypothetical protein